MGDIRDRLLVERAMKIEELAARVAALEDLHRRNVEQVKHHYKGEGHQCDWRVIAEAVANRSTQALEAKVEAEVSDG